MNKVMKNLSSLYRGGFLALIHVKSNILIKIPLDLTVQGMTSLGMLNA